MYSRRKQMEGSVGFQQQMKLLLFVLAVEWSVLLVPCHSVMPNEVAALAAFRREIFEDPFSVLSDWNAAVESPCSWTGVICSQNQDNVVSLNLSGLSLKGFLAPELGLLISLQQLYLDNNMLLGTIPRQIGMLKSLTVLNLSMNHLTGPLPAELGDLVSISKIDLHSNGLSGSIPPELGKLEKLVELRLDRNKLDGAIPGSKISSFSPNLDGRFAPGNKVTGLCQSPQLRNADFSYNFFVGKIPQCLKYLPRSSFQGNCFDDNFSVLPQNSQTCKGGPLKSQEVPIDVSIQSKKEHKGQKLQQPGWHLILAVATGAFVLVCFLVAAAIATTCKLEHYVKMPWEKSRVWRDEMASLHDDVLLNNVPRFTREELEVACEYFSNIIGSSSDCIVCYKGTMKDGREIAVISLCVLEEHWTSYFEFIFQTKVADLSRLNHENVAKLLGYCKGSDPFSRMLVFDYASNGTLYEHLHYGEGSQLSWLRRMRIILGISRALRYLHTDMQPPFPICELNSNSVYLTEEFSPKLVDFESWKIPFQKSGKNDSYTGSGDSFHGYRDSQQQQDMEIQDNIFAFGVLLLEIISGRPAYCKDRGYLVDWAMQHLHHPHSDHDHDHDDMNKLVDPDLTNVNQEELAAICSAASLCIDSDPSKRPSMQIISSMLEKGIDLSPAAILRESKQAWADLAVDFHTVNP